jgi:Male gamete fusion factor
MLPIAYSVLLSKSSVFDFNQNTGICKVKLLAELAVDHQSTDTIEVTEHDHENVEPLQLSVTSHSSTVRYSLKYKSTVNGAAYESVSKSRHCESSGFCCPCVERRGDCNLGDVLADRKTSHFIKLPENDWWSLFEIESIISRSYAVVEVDGEKFTVSEQTPRIKIKGKRLQGSLTFIGAYSKVANPRTYEDRYFAIPGKTITLDTDLIGNTAILLDKSKLDLSGNTCNKLGVTQAALVNSGCGGRKGDCTRNQMTDLETTIAKETICGEGNTIDVEGHSIICTLSQRSPAKVLISLEAKDIKILRTVCEGTILQIDHSFSSTDHLFVVKIRNLDKFLKADFLVSMTCEKFLFLKTTAVSISLLPEEASDVQFRFLQSFESVGQVNCEALLQDMGSATPISTKLISVNLEKIQENRMNQSAGEAKEVIVYIPEDSGTCAECGFFNFACLVSRGCYSKMTGSVSAILFGGLAGLGFIYFFPVILSSLMFLFSCCSCCCRRK